MVAAQGIERSEKRNVEQLSLADAAGVPGHVGHHHKEIQGAGVVADVDRGGQIRGAFQPGANARHPRKGAAKQASGAAGVPNPGHPRREEQQQGGGENNQLHGEKADCKEDAGGLGQDTHKGIIVDRSAWLSWRSAPLANTLTRSFQEKVR